MRRVEIQWVLTEKEQKDREQREKEQVERLKRVARVRADRVRIEKERVELEEIDKERIVADLLNIYSIDDSRSYEAMSKYLQERVIDSEYKSIVKEKKRVEKIRNKYRYGGIADMLLDLYGDYFLSMKEFQEKFAHKSYNEDDWCIHKFKEGEYLIVLPGQCHNHAHVVGYYKGNTCNMWENPTEDEMVDNPDNGGCNRIIYQLTKEQVE